MTSISQFLVISKHSISRFRVLVRALNLKVIGKLHLNRQENSKRAKIYSSVFKELIISQWNIKHNLYNSHSLLLRFTFKTSELRKIPAFITLFVRIIARVRHLIFRRCHIFRKIILRDTNGKTNACADFFSRTPYAARVCIVYTRHLVSSFARRGSSK